MKKILTAVMMAATTLTAGAADYTTPMTVSAGNGATKDPAATVTVTDNTDGTCNVTLKNITLTTATGEKNLGSVTIENLQQTAAGVYTLISGNKSVEILAGDDKGTAWQGPAYTTECGGKVPAYFAGELRGGKIYANILLDTYASTLGEAVAITLGDDYTVGQIANSDLESFHTAKAGTKTSDEPDAWHSFMSCTGSLKGFVQSTPHTFISNQVRPGSTGSKSVLVTSSTAIGSIVANGTITTGQMNAGAMSAADTKNNAFLDFTNSSTDAKGAPFYTTVDALPDSIALWVKFVQGTPNAEYPYATMSAAITDGSRYQDPEATGTTYTNVVAKAKNTEITSNKGAWQRITVPFDYASYAANSAKANAILVTISTNATPGKGSGKDSLNVDDVELIYNAKLSTLKFKGEEIKGFAPGKLSGYSADSKTEVKADDIEAVADGKGAVVTTTVSRSEDAPGKAKAVVSVVSADLKTVSRYVIDFTEPKTDGINTIETKVDCGAQAQQIFNINGQRVSEMLPGGIYLLKTAGKTIKVVKR